MKNNELKVTVITPSYNQGQYIEETILSVLSQTYKNIEYILVDGGSTDNTMEVVNKYRDKIDIIIHEKDKGQSDAINKGFKLAKGELVGWINSDDILYSHAVEKIVNLYNNHLEAAVIMPTKVNWIDMNSQLIKVRSINGRSKKGIVNNDYDIVQQGSFYNRQYLINCNYCKQDLNYCMDLDLVLRLLNYGPIYFIDDIISGFRMHGETKTANGKNKFLEEIYHTLKYNGLSLYSKNSIKLGKESMKNFIKDAIRVY